jgi:hypothetical protein
VLSLTKADELAEAGMVRSMVLGVLGFLGRARMQVGPATMLAAALATALVVVALAMRQDRRAPIIGATAVVLVLAGYVRTRPVVDAALNAWTTASGVGALRGTVLPPGAPVRDRVARSALTSIGQQRQRLMLYEFYLPDNPFYRDGHTPDGVFAPYVFAPVDTPTLRDRGAQIVWRDPVAAIALWVEPGP